MIYKIELPIECELFINSYDVEDLVKVVNPIEIVGILDDDEAKELVSSNKIARIDIRIRQTDNTK